ncbi:MAG: hypothetical protein HY897_16245 [Deltaproteobacteria bacterium]|nr:hypothetical protein [Deltaproteobacteria bacterium]
MATYSLNGPDATALFHLAAHPSPDNLVETLKSLSSDEAREIARAVVDPATVNDPAVRDAAHALRLWAERRSQPVPPRR